MNRILTEKIVEKMYEKIDAHLHVSPSRIPGIGKVHISSAEEMIAHMDELGIKKGILMSVCENKGLMSCGSNEDNRKITERFPNRYAWMCNLDYKNREKICVLWMIMIIKKTIRV